MNWKDESLTPYSQNLKNLIDLKTLREELTTWAVSHDSLSIQKDHRSHVVPLVIRVLTPKVRKLKLLGSRKVGIYLAACPCSIMVRMNVCILNDMKKLSYILLHCCASTQALVIERQFSVSFY